MQRQYITKTSSMPLASPSYPKGPYRFMDREYFIVTYRSDPKAIRAAVPKPLEPDGSNLVLYEFVRMQDRARFGEYTESGIVIPCKYKREGVNFTPQLYLDGELPLTAGREIWGFPEKKATPKLENASDTLTGTLEYAGQLVAKGTMAYKQTNLTKKNQISQEDDSHNIVQKLSRTQVNLKLIPGVDGYFCIAQLVAYNLADIQVKRTWSGTASLHLIPHVNAPVADLPVQEVLGGTHFIADLTLPYGRVLFDYLA